MVLNTDKFDQDLLKRFLRKHGLEGAAEVNQTCLVYHRGAGLDTTSGLFIFEKVALLDLSNKSTIHHA